MAREPSPDYNRLHWDEFFNTNSQDVRSIADGLLRAGLELPTPERYEVGDVAGLDGIHLQCGLGIDTLSLARAGSRMVGVDFSASACDGARYLAHAVGLDCEFICADVTDPQLMRGQAFDFVYTTRGVLRWVPNLAAWAGGIRRMLRPSGWLYLHEVHPLYYRLDAISSDGAFTIRGNYFETSGETKELAFTHVGDVRNWSNRTVTHYDWPLSSIIQAIIDSGLRVTMLREHPSPVYRRQGKGFNADAFDLEGPRPMPLAFSLMASLETPVADAKQGWTGARARSL